MGMVAVPNPERKNTTERGYGTEHQKLRKQWEPKVKAGVVICARCRKWIAPQAAWDLGHDDIDRGRYTGPEHAACNRATSAHRVARQGSRRQLPQWWPR
jgi:hypothetical protein